MHRHARDVPLAQREERRREAGIVLDAAGERIAKARYYDADLIVGEIQPKLARRRRIAAPLLRDEDLDLTINELIRIRARPTRLEGKREVAVLKPVTTRARRAKRS